MHAVFNACGRKYGWGVTIDLLAQALTLCAEFADLNANRIIITTIPVIAFTETYHKGTYVLFCKENWQPYWHFCTCINGIIQESGEDDFSNKVVISAWHIV